MNFSYSSEQNELIFFQTHDPEFFVLSSHSFCLFRRNDYACGKIHFQVFCRSTCRKHGSETGETGVSYPAIAWDEVQNNFIAPELDLQVHPSIIVVYFGNFWQLSTKIILRQRSFIFVGLLVIPEFSLLLLIIKRAMAALRLFVYACVGVRGGGG